MKTVIKISMLTLFLIPTVHAKLSLPIKPDETVHVEVAAQRYNRLFVKGERIQAVRGVSGEYELEKDEASGEVYLKIKEEVAEPVALFIITEKAHHYQLLLTSDEEADAVVELVPVVSPPPAPMPVPQDATQPLIDFVAMGFNSKPSTLVMTAIQSPREQYIQDALVLIPQQQFSNAHYQGVLYQVTNRSDKPHLLQGDYFHSQGVVAVGMPRTVLNPQASTRVLVVQAKQVSKETK